MLFGPKMSWENLITFCQQRPSRCTVSILSYESVMDLFAHQLDGYAWNNLAHGQQAYETAKKKGKSFIDLYDHTQIEENVREFLDYFVPRKVMAGNEFLLKTCPRVIRKFLRWMREKKRVDLTNDEMKDMCENQLWEDTVRDMGL